MRAICCLRGVDLGGINSDFYATLPFSERPTAYLKAGIDRTATVLVDLLRQLLARTTQQFAVSLLLPLFRYVLISLAIQRVVSRFLVEKFLVAHPRRAILDRVFHYPSVSLLSF